MSDNFGLPSESIKKICEVFSLHPKISKVVIYGSRAKGNYRPGSDIDLAIYSEDLAFDDILKIENYLDELLLPYTFDILLFKDLSDQNLIEHIERVGKVFYVRK